MRGSHAASLGSTHSADGYGLLVRRDGVEVWSKPSDEISGRITSTQEAQSLGVMVADPGVYDAVECDYVEEPGSYGSIGSVTSNIGTQLRSLTAERDFDSPPLHASMHQASNPLSGAGAGDLASTGPATYTTSYHYDDRYKARPLRAGASHSGEMSAGSAEAATAAASEATVGGDPNSESSPEVAVEAGTGRAAATTGAVIIEELQILEKTGMLSKRGQTRKNWKSRYFVLSKATLRYYENPDQDVPLGAISLRDAVIDEVPYNKFGKLYSFSAKTADNTRELFMHASTKQSMEEWIRIMCAAAAYRGDAADDSLHDEIVAPVKMGTNIRNVVGRTYEQAARAWVDNIVPVIFCRSCRAEEELWTGAFSHSARVGASNASAVGLPQDPWAHPYQDDPPRRLAQIEELGNASSLHGRHLETFDDLDEEPESVRESLDPENDDLDEDPDGAEDSFVV